ncbi:hypothetical protein ACFQGT_10240 [Natrialbaceae archaeon GCM10025810]|uniref:hypothetical protein n=1 Tax=Halovalidus salilacus TaxID=3075124 RepID=UPI0036115C5C
MRKTRVAVLAVLAMVLVGGCLDTSVTTEVGADGDVESMETAFEVDAFTYTLLEESAKEEGYDSLEEMLEDDAGADYENDEVESINASTEQLEDGEYRIALTATDVDPDAIDELEITVDGDTIRYEDTSFNGSNPFGSEFGEFEDDAWTDDGLEDEGAYDGGENDEWTDENWSEDEWGDDNWSDDEWAEDNWSDDEWSDDEFGELFDFEMAVEYVVVMPGEIQDHNADEISDDGTTATWEFTFDEDVDDDSFDEEMESLYVESTIDEGAEGADGDSIPGFGVGVAAVSLLGAAIGVLLRGDR